MPCTAAARRTATISPRGILRDGAFGCRNSKPGNNADTYFSFSSLILTTSEVPLDPISEFAHMCALFESRQFIFILYFGRYGDQRSA